jgi:hypothetical protein
LNAKLKALFALFLILSTNSLLATVSRTAADTSTPTFRYLSDPDNDSTEPQLAPWGEIVEMWVKDDAIVIRSKGVIDIFDSTWQYIFSGYYLFFLDEDLDNRTDVVFRYAKRIDIYNQPSPVIEYCHLYRFTNHTYYHHGAWQYPRDYFDPRTEEDTTLNQTVFHLGGATKQEVRIKVVSYYVYDPHTTRPWINPGGPRARGGDLVPNCSWNISDVTSPPNLESADKIVNDTRFQYPSETLVFGESQPPEVQPSLTIWDYLNGIRDWMASNTITTAIIVVFSITAVYSIIRRTRKEKHTSQQDMFKG